VAFHIPQFIFVGVTLFLLKEHMIAYPDTDYLMQFTVVVPPIKNNIF
jgi:hypothetical protein